MVPTNSDAISKGECLWGNAGNLSRGTGATHGVPGHSRESVNVYGSFVEAKAQSFAKLSRFRLMAMVHSGCRSERILSSKLLIFMRYRRIRLGITHR